MSGPEGSSGDSQFYEVPIDIYPLNTKVDEDLYFYYQRQYILFKTRKTAWSLADIERIKNSNIESLFIRFNSPADHHRFLHAKLVETLERPGAPLKQKAQLLTKISAPVLSTIYKTPGSAEVMEGAVDHVKDCIQFLNEKGSLSELIRLSAGSMTEHVHALHVAAYSIALCKKVGYKEPSQIFAMGMGALLHDIGKSQLDKKIVNKEGELTDEEWQLMRQHPEMGDQLLERKRMVPLLSRRIVLEHHERPNGKGYPKGIRNVHVFSKMVSIADCFNSLITQKPYGQTLVPFEAIKYMATRLRSEFDLALLEKFIEMLSE